MSLDKIIETGSYTGNGASQTITIGWQPCLVVVASSRTGGPGTGRAISFKTTDMSGDSAWLCDTDSRYLSGTITITSTGFSVGSDDRVNDSGETFHWIAVREYPAVDCGQYIGNVSATQTITLDRQPSALFQFIIDPGVNPFDCWWKLSSMSGSFASRYRQTITWLEFIVTLISTGFTAGSATNQLLATYVYIALYNVVGSTHHFETGNYNGSGTSQSIALGYQPRFVFIWPYQTEPNAAFKTDTMGTDEAGRLDTTYTYESGLVSITSSGFTLPLGSAVNTIGASYFYLVGRY